MANYLRYATAQKGSTVCLELKGNDVYVRKGTPDIWVALNNIIRGEFDALLNYLSAEFSGVIIDAGGYIGTAALVFANAYPNAKIVTIEPSVKNLDVLLLNVKRHSNVQVIHGALVGKPRSKVTLLNRGTGEWGFTAVETPLDNHSAEQLHDAPAYTIGELGIKPSEIGILKLDVEGGEYDLLKNDSETLAQVYLIAAELHDRIVPGCSDLFVRFSKDRTLIKGSGDKYFSINHRSSFASFTNNEQPSI